MKSLNLIFTLSLCVFFHIAVAQSEPTFSRQQMRSDFDTLVTVLKRVSPHIPVKKDLWHYDALKEMQLLRKQIDTISSDLSYFILLQSTINAAQDLHTSLWGEQSGWGKTQESLYRQVRNRFRLSLGNIYQDGKYLITDPFVVARDTITIGTEIVSVNGERVHAYLKERLWARDGAAFDMTRKQFFSPGFFKNTESIFQNSLTFGFKKPDGKVVTYNLPTDRFTQYLPSKSFDDTCRVEFWPKEKVLYIRLPRMDESFKPYLAKSITAYRERVNTISRIIIDIRGNGGGNDNVWQDLYADLIDRPISYTLQIDAYPGVLANTLLREPDRSPLLRHYGLHRVVDKTETIEPSPQSIRFKGKIIVLAERHYSSAGSMLAVANANPNDQLVGMGRKTGYFLGIGFAPQVFELPVTKLRYRVAPSLEVSRAVRAADLAQDKMEVMVPGDIAFYQHLFDEAGVRSQQDFLIRYDPFIRTALGLE
jgi:hypothetical protein